MAKKYSEARMELARIVRYDYNKLLKRIENVEKRYGQTPARTALEEKGLSDLSVTGLSTEQLGKIRSDILEISQYPSSYVKNKEVLTNYNRYVTKWIDMFDNDRDTYDKVMKIYGRQVNENGWTQHVKYKVLEELTNNVSQMSEAELHQYIREFVDKEYKLYESNNNDIQGGRAYETVGKVRSRR